MMGSVPCLKLRYTSIKDFPDATNALLHRATLTFKQRLKLQSA